MHHTERQPKQNSTHRCAALSQHPQQSCFACIYTADLARSQISVQMLLFQGSPSTGSVPTPQSNASKHRYTDTANNAQHCTSHPFAHLLCTSSSQAVSHTPACSSYTTRKPVPASHHTDMKQRPSASRTQLALCLESTALPQAMHLPQLTPSSLQPCTGCSSHERSAGTQALCTTEHASKKNAVCAPRKGRHMPMWCVLPYQMRHCHIWAGSLATLAKVQE
jgi:hypothetical protein